MFSRALTVSAAIVATAIATTTDQQYYSPYVRSYAPRSYAPATRLQQRTYRHRHPITQKLIDPKSPHPAFQLSYEAYKSLKDKVDALGAAGADNDALISRVGTLETDLAAEKGKLETAEGTIVTLENAANASGDAVTALTARVAAEEAKVASLQATAALDAPRITALEAADVAVEARVENLELTVADALPIVNALIAAVDIEEAKVVLLEATAEKFENQAVTESGWTSFSSVPFPSDGLIILATFCVEGPAVVEVLTQISIRGEVDSQQKRLSIFVDEGATGTFVEKANQTEFSNDDEEEQFSVDWMGLIATDSIVEIRVLGPAQNSLPRNFVRGGGTISYKVYDESYPFEASLPACT